MFLRHRHNGHLTPKQILLRTLAAAPFAFLLYQGVMTGINFNDHAKPGSMAWEARENYYLKQIQQSSPAGEALIASTEKGRLNIRDVATFEGDDLIAEHRSNKTLISPELHYIEVSRDKNDGSLIWYVTHEITHHWQRQQGLYDGREQLNLHDQILLTRFTEAAAEMTAAHILGQLGRNGYGRYLNQASFGGGSMSADTLSRYRDALITGQFDERSLARQAITDWFTNLQMVSLYDLDNINNYPQWRLTPPARKLDAAWVQRCFTLPGADNSLLSRAQAEAMLRDNFYVGLDSKDMPSAKAKSGGNIPLKSDMPSLVFDQVPAATQPKGGTVLPPKPSI